MLINSSLSKCSSRITDVTRDRKSTRLNSSHGYISYAVFCLKKKNICILPKQREKTTQGFAMQTRLCTYDSRASTEPFSYILPVMCSPCHAGVHHRTCIVPLA